MKTYKTCGVVMLPTKEKSIIGLNPYSDKLFTNTEVVKGKEDIFIPYFGQQDVWRQAQHLYITSDEEIKEGDWYSTVNGNTFEPMVAKCNRDSLYFANNTVCDGKKKLNKIVASTDPSLGFPQIPQSFILHYISEYNKGNKIEKVEVEYENVRKNTSKSNPLNKVKTVESLLINPDNTISIKPIKESWTREEVENLCVVALQVGYDLCYDKKGISDIFINKWINQNL